MIIDSLGNWNAGWRASRVSETAMRLSMSRLFELFTPFVKLGFFLNNIIHELETVLLYLKF